MQATVMCCTLCQTVNSALRHPSATYKTYLVQQALQARYNALLTALPTPGLSAYPMVSPQNAV